MVDLFVASILILCFAIFATIVVTGILTFLGVVKGLDLEHLHDDEE
jgi:uncharacterized membrane protein